MNWTEAEYDRVAQHLDGLPVDLTPGEQALAEDVRREEATVGQRLDAALPADGLDAAWQRGMLAAIRRAEAVVGAMLDAPVPRATMDRAARRLRAELARPTRRALRFILPGAAVAAVAAAVLLAAVVLPWLISHPSAAPDGAALDAVASRRPMEPAARRSAGLPLDILAASVQGPETLTIDVVADEVDRLEAEMRLAAPARLPMDLRIDQIQRNVENFWLDEPADDPLDG